MTAFLGATRTAYDIFADDYAERFNGELPDRPFERAMRKPAQSSDVDVVDQVHTPGRGVRGSAG